MASYSTGGKTPPKGNHGLYNDSSDCSVEQASKGTAHNTPYLGERRGAGGTGSSGNVSNK